ncbi:hypothetical protein WA158_008329 [Blastocystis sp. Blastoise]
MFRLARLAPAARNAFQVRSFAAAQSFLDKALVTDRMVSVVKGFDAVDAAKVTPKAHFTKDLGLDSLNVVELLLAVEEEFCVEIPDDVAEKIHSVDDAINFVSSHPQAK